MSHRKIVIDGVTYVRSRDAARVANLALDCLKQTTTPSVSDFVVRAPDVAASVGASAAFLFVVALFANVIMHRDRGRNVWVTAILFAVAYGALIYGARTSAGISMLVDTFF